MHQFGYLVEEGVPAVRWGMSEALVVQSLKNKRSEIHGRIAAHEAQIVQAKCDLAHVNHSFGQEVHPCGVALATPGDMLALQCWTALDRLPVEHDARRTPPSQSAAHVRGRCKRQTPHTGTKARLRYFWIHNNLRAWSDLCRVTVIRFAAPAHPSHNMVLCQ